MEQNTTTTIKEGFGARLEAEYGRGEYRGFPLKLRRMRSNLLYLRGQMPQYFADLYRRAKEGEDVRDENPELTETERRESERFRRAIICDATVEPRLTEDAAAIAAGDADFLLDDVPEDVQQFIYLYGVRKLNFPEQQSEEVATAETLERFLYDGERTTSSVDAD